ncbi:hypothetical protein BKA62DRAFT_783489 [Auriculariales sp. MPI-PUGE-AT-0066]|nr:hypothetical protein BKA62DRAFT_783489 [Auriculariales sp. MPI-PUGE-AT-0066]
MSVSAGTRKRSHGTAEKSAFKRPRNIDFCYILLDPDYRPIAVNSFDCGDLTHLTVSSVKEYLSKTHAVSVQFVYCVGKDKQLEWEPLHYYETLNEDWRTFLKLNGLGFTSSKFDEERGRNVWIFVTTMPSEQNKHVPPHKAYPLPRTRVYLTQLQLGKYLTIEQAQKPWLECIRQAPPPSTAVKDSHLKQNQHLGNQAALYNGRPATLTGPPLGVYHPVFARFWRLVEEREDAVLTPEHLRLATELIDKSTEFYGDEKERLNAIRQCLETFIGDVVRTCANGREPDGGPLIDTFAGRIMINPFIEIKKEIGAGSCDPFDQAAANYAQWVGKDKDRLPSIRQRSCMPAFLLAIAGPNLAIGGALLLDRPVIEQLTPWIPLRYRPTVPPRPDSVAPTHDQIQYIARVIVALRKCSDDLLEYYKTTLVSMPERTEFAVPWPHLTKISDYEVVYQERLQPTPSRCLFRATATARQDNTTISVIVKFTYRYCREAHDVVYAKGAAPRLLYCAWDETVAQMVVMYEYIDATKVDHTRQQLSWDQSVSQLEDAVEAMHQKGFVHGDLRGPNILLDGNNAPMIIDFDWAGRADSLHTIYPGNICLDSSYKLHTDVCPGGRILPEHDDHLVKKWSHR